MFGWHSMDSSSGALFFADTPKSSTSQTTSYHRSCSVSGRDHLLLCFPYCTFSWPEVQLLLLQQVQKQFHRVNPNLCCAAMSSLLLLVSDGCVVDNFLSKITEEKPFFSGALFEQPAIE